MGPPGFSAGCQLIKIKEWLPGVICTVGALFGSLGTASNTNHLENKRHGKKIDQSNRIKKLKRKR